MELMQRLKSLQSKYHITLSVKFKHLEISGTKAWASNKGDRRSTALDFTLNQYKRKHQ